MNFNPVEQEFIKYTTMIAELAHSNSANHGFWQEEDSVTVRLKRLCLVHSEVGECSEGVRKSRMDDHLPERTMEAAEMADALIRIFDYCAGYNIPLAEVVLEKMAYNADRPHMHGKMA